MKPLFCSSLVLLFFSVSTTSAQLVPAGLDASLRPQTHLEKAALEGWTERVEERQTHSSTYEGPNGLVTVYQSSRPVNYVNARGELTPIDIRCTETYRGWISAQRPDPVTVTTSGSACIEGPGGFSMRFGQTLSFNGQYGFETVSGQMEQQSTVRFENIQPGISKAFHFRYSGIKYEYRLSHVPATSGSHLVIAEEVELPVGYALKPAAGEGQNNEGNWTGNLVIEHLSEKRVYGRVYALLCYDAAGQTTTGSYRIVGSTRGKYRLELLVPASWLTDANRQYPVTIDPLVTGPTTSYPPNYIASCFFPAYNADSINITVPAGISVTALNITASFYADPFTTTVMADGRMYFSTNCGQSTVFQVAPPAGSTPGTAYLDNYNIQAPLMCCYPQQCSAYNFWLRFHISRTSNGPACGITYLYYDPFTTSWPFSAYVQGYTAETYAGEMIFVPATICANTCTVEARVFARYGVPPYTFTHPWSADTIVAGTALGCGAGNQMKSLILDIPSCPVYCDTSTSLSVPPPVVTDACGTVVSGYNTGYGLGIKPVPTASFSTDTIQVCGGQAFSATVNSCLPGSTLSWTGNGQSGTTLVVDTLVNVSGGMQQVTYTATASLAGCTGTGDTLVVLSWPQAVAAFSVTEGTLMPGETISFTNESLLNGNTAGGYTWIFEDSTLQITENATQVYTDTGTYMVCLVVSTALGCNDTTCRSFVVMDVALLLPNIITPNGDGHNDVLRIKALEYYPENTLTVFNRWGNKVYEKQNYANDWKAPDLADGTYYYFLKVPNKPEMRSVLQVTR